MKTTILTLAILLGSIISFGQNSNYEKVMKETKLEYDSAKTIEDFSAISNKFERIAVAEKDKWLPYYYASFSLISINFMQTDNMGKDQLLDRAQKLCDKALEIAPKESELYILQAMVYSGRLTIDPMARGMEYAPKLSAAYAKATEYNPENPRTYFLQGNQVYHTPVNFGGGPKNSLPILETAKIKFENFKPKSDLHPNWGKDENLKILAKCKEAVK